MGVGVVGMMVGDLRRWLHRRGRRRRRGEAGAGRRGRRRTVLVSCEGAAAGEGGRGLGPEGDVARHRHAPVRHRPDRERRRRRRQLRCRPGSWGGGHGGRPGTAAAGLRQHVHLGVLADVLDIGRRGPARVLLDLDRVDVQRPVPAVNGRTTGADAPDAPVAALRGNVLPERIPRDALDKVRVLLDLLDALTCELAGQHEHHQRCTSESPSVAFQILACLAVSPDTKKSPQGLHAMS